MGEGEHLAYAFPTPAYPLTQFDGTMKSFDWSAAPHIPAPPTSGHGETKWVVPEKFFDQFVEVLDTVPPLPGEEAHAL